MDTNWCLTCGQHLTTDAPYCSAACMSVDRPSTSAPNTRSSSFHTLSDYYSSVEEHIVFIQDVPKSQWPGSHQDGIRAWAASIPCGSSPGVSRLPSPESSTHSSRASSPHPTPSARIRTPRLPKLLEARPMAPTLCMSTPKSVLPRPSKPIQTPHQSSIASLQLARSAADSNMSMSSLLSGITESFVATPSSISLDEPTSPTHKPRLEILKPHVFEVLATQVRSWVSPSPLALHAAALRLPASVQPTHDVYSTLKKRTQLEAAVYSGSDDHLARDAWWACENKGASRPSSQIKPPCMPAPRLDSLARHFQVVAGRQDHPTYRARGRRAARA